MSVIPTPNERCRWLEMAGQLRRSRRFARGRRGKSTRLQFEANFGHHKESLFHICLNYGGHTSPPKR